MKALILSGGYGTRLRPLTYSQQKQLIPVANRPVLFYAIDDCVAAGARDVGVVTGPNADQVEAAVLAAHQAGAWPDVTFRFLHQGTPKGLAHAILVAEELGFLDDRTPFVMYLGDNILSGGIRHLADAFLESYARDADRTGASILLCPVDDPTKFGIAELDDEGRLVRLVEKPKEPTSDLAVVGVYFFAPAVHRATKAIRPSWRNELEIVDAIQWLLDHGHTVETRQVEGWWKDTGGPLDLLGANRLVLDALPDGAPPEGRPGVVGRLEGRVRVGTGATVDEASVVRGPVILGAGARLVRSHVGPFTSVGPGCLVEDAHVEDSILLEGSTLKGVRGVRESVLGRGAAVTGHANGARGRRFLVGDESRIEI